jgi:hypothetical protein
MAQSHAVKLDLASTFCAIHSKMAGDTGRVILGSSTMHLDVLLARKEQEAYVGDNPTSEYVDCWFRDICKKAALGLGISIRDMEGTEMVKNEPFSKGQVEHMDGMWGVWNFLAPLVPCPMTRVKVQTYHDYPENMGPKSTVPKNWASMHDVPLEWEVGDLFLMRSNAIHCGPPNGGNHRYVLFGSESSIDPNGYTDGVVVTEEEFFFQKDSHTQ